MGKLLYPVLFILIFASCKDNSSEVVYLNNELTTINDSLFYKGRTWGEEFKIAFTENDYAQLVSARRDVQSYIENSISRVNRMEDVGGSEEFRRAELDYLRFEKDSIVPKMIRFEDIDSAVTQDEINAAYLSLISTARTEQQKLENIRRIQKEYADKNDIELKESSLSHVE